MNETIDRTELVARRLARHDGLDPDALGLPPDWRMHKGAYAQQVPEVAHLRRVWQIYIPVAEAALEAVDQFATDMKRFAAEQERAKQVKDDRPWMAWSGTRPGVPSPDLPIGTRVDIQFRDDRMAYGEPWHLFRWNHTNDIGDIVAWRFSANQSLAAEPAATEAQWTPWNGGKFPPDLPAQAFVDVQLRDGRTKTHRPFEYMSWWQDGSPVDIIAWRLSADESPENRASTAASRNN
jgi:hypothetical protein